MNRNTFGAQLEEQKSSVHKKFWSQAVIFWPKIN